MIHSYCELRTIDLASEGGQDAKCLPIETIIRRMPWRCLRYVRTRTSRHESERFQTMITRAIFFPFDLFGSPGTRAGAESLADAFRDMLDDNKREKVATRARAYARKVHVEEFHFENLADYSDWRAKARARLRQVFRQNEFLLWISG